MNLNLEYILCAAIHYKVRDSLVHRPSNVENGIVICGWRHHNCIEIASRIGINKEEHVQGFLTSKNRFLTREEARTFAIEVDQIFADETFHKDMLFSEDLY